MVTNLDLGTLFIIFINPFAPIMSDWSLRKPLRTAATNLDLNALMLVLVSPISPIMLKSSLRLFFGTMAANFYLDTLFGVRIHPCLPLVKAQETFDVHIPPMSVYSEQDRDF